jgi:hypothetical protein
MDEEAFSQWHHGAVAYAEKAVDVTKIRKEYERMFSLD